MAVPAAVADEEEPVDPGSVLLGAEGDVAHDGGVVGLGVGLLGDGQPQLGTVIVLEIQRVGMTVSSVTGRVDSCKSLPMHAD